MKNGVNLRFFDVFRPMTVQEIKRHQWNNSRWSGYVSTPRPQWGLILLLKGRMDYTWEGGSLSLKAGDLAFLPKGCCYDVEMKAADKEVEDFILNFESEGQEGGVPLRVGSHMELFEELFEQVRVSYDRNEPYLLQARFCRLLHQLTLGLKGQENELLEQAASLLEQELSVGEIAHRCNISESSLRRLFIKEFGMGPVAYRTERKLKEACRLLLSTDRSVGEIADELGFFDESYFCKVFLRERGETPAQYRKRYQTL